MVPHNRIQQNYLIIRTNTLVSAMNSFGLSAGGSASNQRRLFHSTDGREAAVNTLALILDELELCGVYNIVTSSVLANGAILKEPSTAGAGLNPEQYKIDNDRYKEQKKGMAMAKISIRSKISDEAWNQMLVYGTHDLHGVMDAREAYAAYVKTFCTFSEVEKMAATAKLRVPWMKHSSVHDHIMRHVAARHELNIGATPIPQLDQVSELNYSLQNLFAAGCHFHSKGTIDSEFEKSEAKANAFNIYVTILMKHDKDGEFSDVNFPVAPINLVKETSRAEPKFPKKSFEVQCKEARERQKDFLLDSNCPEHKNPSKSGKFHKWRECGLRTGVMHGSKVDGK